MPIKPELRGFYGKQWRTVTRPRILARAGHKCEKCGKPHGERVIVVSMPVAPWGWTQFWALSHWTKWVRCTDGAIYSSTVMFRLFRDVLGTAHAIRVVLTIAHLNHVAGDDRDENLKALCQYCHLNYDKLHHRDSRAKRKDAARPLLQEAI